ncbi:MAG: hypothetical protein ABI321_20470 [Polyangia bacterium]
MALAQIIDLGERRARRAAAAQVPARAVGPSNDAMSAPWPYGWMPMYAWYVA